MKPQQKKSKGRIIQSNFSTPNQFHLFFSLQHWQNVKQLKFTTEGLQKVMEGNSTKIQQLQEVCKERRMSQN